MSLLLLGGLGLLAGACGSVPPSSVASLGTTAASAPPASAPPAAAPGTASGGSGGPSTASTKYRAALAYVECMRAHGVSDFPDPTSDGQITVHFAFGGKDGAPGSSGIDRNSPQYISADQACRRLLPGGVPTPAQRQQSLAAGVRFAQCMRSHGVPGFPDPTTADVVHLGAGIDPSSPLFQKAQKACQSLVPGTGSKT